MLLLLAIGCAEPDDVTLTGPHDHSSTGAVDCVGADTYVPGLSRTTAGSGASVALVSADPDPPDVGDNRWVVEVTDAAGEPVEGAALTVSPYMPLHQHGLTPAAYAGRESAPGTYDVDPFDLIMPGIWEFTVDLADGADGATFLFCAEG